MSQPMPVDVGPMARLEDVKRDEGAPQEIFRLLAEGETLRQIAKTWALPKGRFVQWFMEGHRELYDAALKVRADELAHAALAISDEQEAVEKKDGTTFDPDVARDRLRVDTRLKLAEKWDRSRYGAQVKVEHAGGVAVDAGLLGTIVDLLGAARAKRLPVLIEGGAGAEVGEGVRHPPALARPPAEEDLI